METPGLALQLRLSEELFQNKKCFTNRLIVVKQSEMTTLCPLVKSLACFIVIHESFGVNLIRTKNCLKKEEISYFLSHFFFIMGNIDQGVGSV